MSNIHALIHADGTISLSMDRAKFIKKYNEAANVFTENKLNLNVGKSCCLVINPKESDEKNIIVLHPGVLKYNSNFEYLGVVIYDCGSIKQNAQSFICHTRANGSIQFSNF